MTKPALSLAAVPGRRKKTIELAQDTERRGFSGLYCPSFGDGLGLCQALACLLYTSPSPRDQRGSRMPSSA